MSDRSDHPARTYEAPGGSFTKESFGFSRPFQALGTAYSSENVTSLWTKYRQSCLNLYKIHCWPMLPLLKNNADLNSSKILLLLPAESLDVV